MPSNRAATPRSASERSQRQRPRRYARRSRTANRAAAPPPESGAAAIDAHRGRRMEGGLKGAAPHAAGCTTSGQTRRRRAATQPRGARHGHATP